MEDHHKDSGLFRFIIGALVMATAIGGFAALFVVRVPPENKDAMMFALGAVFGWAAGVVASEFGATSTGRKVTDQVVRTMERQSAASTEPTQVQVVNAPTDPVPVEPSAGEQP